MFSSIEQLQDQRALGICTGDGFQNELALLRMRWIKSNIRFLAVALVSHQSRIRKILRITTCIEDGCITGFRGKLLQGHFDSILLRSHQVVLACSLAENDMCAVMVCASLSIVFVNVQRAIVFGKPKIDR